MKKVLGIINITIILIGMMLFCCACGDKGEIVPTSSTSLENVENITLPESGWVTVL